MTKCNPIKILITGCGAPGISGTVHSLKNNPNNDEVFLVGTDTNEEAVGKFFCDRFEIISSFKNEEDYLNDIKRIVHKHSINVILPQNTLELPILSKKKKYFSDMGAVIVISDYEAINNANNKFKLMKVAESLSLPTPKNFVVSNFKELKNAAKNLGWPEKRIVVNPPESNGSRGVRIIDENISLQDEFFNQKPGSLYIKLQMLEKILGASFPELLVMEYLDGDEYSVDIFRLNENTTVVPRIRTNIKSGITFSGKVVRNLEIEKFSKKLSIGLDLNYCFGFQFIMKDNIPYIIECNPRVQGSMVISTLSNANLIYNSIQAVLDNPICPMNINYNISFSRFWGGISHNANEKVEVI
jgi:carbamoyl-phosphate synthase large subunit